MTDFGVPFVRWADTVSVVAGGHGALTRQLYDHELVYILEGRGHVVLDGQKHLAEPDSLFLVRPRVFHSFSSDLGEAQRLLGVHFDWVCQNDVPPFEKFVAATPPIVSQWFRAPRSIWNSEQMPFLDLRGRPRVRRMLEDVVNEHGRSDGESRQVAGALLAAAIGQIEREARFLSEMARHEKVGPDAVRRVQKARELLERADANRLSIEDIAARVGWSSDHLRRMTRAVLDMAPAQIQTAARLRRARELLRYGAVPIAEIARKCGFDDASHFARVFKRETGQTPREWAILARGEQNVNREH